LQRLNGLPTRADLHGFGAYEQFFCNSQYTQGWVRRIWQRESEVIYPLVAPIASQQTAWQQPASQQPRQRTIVSVGRFFRYNGATKRHEVLVRAFRNLVDAGLTGWTLQLMGGLNTRIGDSETYLAELREMAQGYPIELHVDAPWSTLTTLLGSASIYWHAMGYGDDLQRHPDRAEHFGITTVEAMSAGCVPIVIDAGGQPEIVREGENGYLWQNLDELQAKTLQVIGDPALRDRLARAAQASSQRFCDADAFRQHVLQVMAGILV
jgi:glycosyltransferase involved in cell wall biosynthesis